MKNDRIFITNIQRFSLHDGPGIRTTVFLKGCSLHCPWCSNPENIESFIQEFFQAGKKGFFGYYLSTDALMEELLKDEVFYGEYSSTCCNIEEILGGVTFSGGEPLLQMKEISSVCEALHAKNIHIAAETSLFVSRELLDIARKHIDLFLVDIKLLDPKRAKQVEGGNIDTFLNNLDCLMNQEKQVIIRIPVIGTYTDNAENRELIIELLSQYKTKIRKVELLREHNLGASKYRALGKKEPMYHRVSDQWIKEYRDSIVGIGIDSEIL